MIGEGFTLAAVVDDLDRAVDAGVADAVEFRLDHAEAPLEQLVAYDGALPLIATNRREDEGGGDPGPDRLETLATATRNPAVTAVDIELATVEDGQGEDVLEAARETDTATIVSWHDFERTPSEVVLERRLRAASAHGTIAKAAVTAQAVADVLPVLAVTQRLTAEGITVATMSMGEPGRHSRVVAPLYGSTVGYAPIDPEEATAPGQFDLATMADLLAALR